MQSAPTYRAYQPNRCYFDMMSNYKKHHRPDNCLVFCNEGGSRSGKTFDAFDFIADFCLISKRPLMIYVFRDTLVNCKDFTLVDFKEKMKFRGLYDDEQMLGEGQRPEYRLKDSVIRFRGLDKMGEKEGFPSDIVFINEVLSGVTKEQYLSVVMRCKLCVILDWNPRYTDYWVFDLEGQPNVFFTHTTFRDNLHAPQSVINSILAYEPTPENIAAGTADEYRWKVYGLGVRAAQEGLVYPNIDWIDEFPDDLEHTAYGIDFGFTNDPTAVIHVGIRGQDLYLHERFYAPVDDPDMLYSIVKPILGANGYAIADSADKYAKNPEGMVKSLQMRGLSVIKAKKFQDSITIGISYMKNFRIHCVRTKNMQIEANSYVWDFVNGFLINRPKDKYNHLWDAARYVVMTIFRNQIAS